MTDAFAVLDPLEAQYFLFPGSEARGPIGERWERDSAASLARHPPTTLPYGEDERRALDLFLPEGVADPPILLFVHGGYWQRRARRDFAWLVPPWLARGVGVALLGYPLAPATRLEEIVDSARQGLAALARARPKARVLLAGHSAGGHLVAMLAREPAPPGMRILGCVPLSGVFELAPLLGTSVNDALALDRTRALALSPRLLSPPSVPVLAVVGGLESGEFRRQTRDFALHAASAAAASLEVPGRNHFDVLDALVEPQQPLVAAMRGLLAG